ncbi:DUF2750 domain-containing protein [Enterovibrio paralichthyis]|uniref:DUF2750 domain-containing protein n=1 Tax=Enterovibrio paralichthyis TaxID=2853805 RepID=UPI001C469EAE|nr:DUF2750 domain-containing protein [Enterovibrio paralichthyis]MBV7297247.1 DUF2750 domain-containing protein [Enterovibrio paralichthyis]
MTSQNPTPVDLFVMVSCESGAIWGLYCDDGWVICDSAIYEETDVMPFWSSREAAAIHCVDEWSDFEPVAIPLETFIDQWLVDLADDGVLLGPDWGMDLSGEEVEAADIANKYLTISA